MATALTCLSLAWHFFFSMSLSIVGDSVWGGVGGGQRLRVAVGACVASDGTAFRIARETALSASAPHTLHPAPCTLHPAPCTLQFILRHTRAHLCSRAYGTRVDHTITSYAFVW